MARGFSEWQSTSVSTQRDGMDIEIERYFRSPSAQLLWVRSTDCAHLRPCHLLFKCTCSEKCVWLARQAFADREAKRINSAVNPAQLSKPISVKRSGVHLWSEQDWQEGNKRTYGLLRQGRTGTIGRLVAIRSCAGAHSARCPVRRDMRQA